jgi:hypothetical protein
MVLFPAKACGDDLSTVVVAAAARAGMAGMAVGVVVDGQRLGCRAASRWRSRFDRFAAHAGSTFLKGLTVTFS